ncbi:MAG: hypothetical protein MJK12_20405 [Colwellia sp.]|nr:hypothetical protein [Colwellia sp.]
MEISNSQANLSINSKISGGTNVQGSVINRQDVARVQFDKEEKPQQKQKDRLDIDPQAIELIQRQDAKQPNQQQAKNTGYDQPSEQNFTAISAYQSIENQSQRDNIQQVFGVDLLA